MGVDGDAIDPIDFPPGISLERTHGINVLRVRDHPLDVPKCLKTLSHPASGADVRVIGSAHVSADSAREVRRVITENKPDLVVIELDGDRLKALLRSASEERPAAHAARRVATPREALRTMMAGEIPLVVGSLGYAVVGAVLDCRPGAEFIAAVESARDVGATVVLGDRSQKATIGRLYARVRRGSTEFDRLASSKETVYETNGPEAGEDESPLSPSSSLDARQTRRANVIAAKLPQVARIMEKAGCKNSEAVVKTSLEVLDSALKGMPIRVDDLLKVRKCAKRVVEFVRVESFNGNPMFTPGSQKGGQKESIMDWATKQTVVRERDLILATALQRDPTVQSIVGVVGAGHVEGISKLWDDIESSDSKKKFNEYLNEWPEDAKPMDYTNRIITSVIGAAALTTIVRRGSPRSVKLAGALVGTVLTVGAVGTYIGVSGLVALGRVAVAIEDASIRAAELGNREDSAHAPGAFRNIIVRDAAVPFNKDQ